MKLKKPPPEGGVELNYRNSNRYKIICQYEKSLSKIPGFRANQHSPLDRSGLPAGSKVGIRLVWRAENKLKVQSAKLKVAVKVKNYEK